MDPFARFCVHKPWFTRFFASLCDQGVVAFEKNSAAHEHVHKLERKRRCSGNNSADLATMIRGVGEWLRRILEEIALILYLAQLPPKYAHF